MIWELDELPIFGNIVLIHSDNSEYLMKNTSIALNEHYQSFINTQVGTGHYASASEVVRAALRLLEAHEMKVQRLRAEIQKGLDSGTVSGEAYQERFRQKREAALKARGIRLSSC